MSSRTKPHVRRSIDGYRLAHSALLAAGLFVLLVCWAAVPLMVLAAVLGLFMSAPSLLIFAGALLAVLVAGRAVLKAVMAERQRPRSPGGAVASKRTT